MTEQLLVINPGSTSTKIALYEGDRQVLGQDLEHSDAAGYAAVMDQYDMRLKAIEAFLAENRCDISKLSAVVGRGGMLLPLRSGAYRVNQVMIDRLRNNPVSHHESNLGALLAVAIARKAGVEAYIYDSVRVDELDDVARVTGYPEIRRISATHTLNSRGMCIELAEQEGRRYQDMNFIVAHMGGGISINVHRQGRMVEVVSDDEGPFSPQRAGAVPCRQLVEMCYSGQYSLEDIKRRQSRTGGLMGYLGTDDTREVERRAQSGDRQALLVYRAMAYQVARAIGSLAPVVKGRVDYIVLTGGIAKSQMFTGWIKEMVEFIAPVRIMPGEREMRSLALGILRVLRGEERAREYIEEDGKVVDA